MMAQSLLDPSEEPTQPVRVVVEHPLDHQRFCRWCFRPHAFPGCDPTLAWCQCKPKRS